MNKRVKISMRKRTVVFDGDDKAPFWLEHFVPLVWSGIAVFLVRMVLLSLTDWGRAAMVWIGLGFGMFMAGRGRAAEAGTGLAVPT